MVAFQPTQHRIVIVLDRASAYTRSIFAGMAAFACEHGPWRFVPLLASIAASEAKLRDAQAAGIIARIATRGTTRAIQAAKLPAVDIGTGGFGIPNVRLDDAAVGRIAATHLLTQELPHYAFCGVPWVWYSKLREEAFVAAISAASRQCSVYTGLAHADTADLRAGVEPRLDEWLRDLPKPVGLMAYDDLRARQMADACKRLGLRVPEDVAVVGAGNDPILCEIGDPPLSSVALAAERVGFEAARLLAQLIEGKPATTHERLIPPVGMVARFSTHVDAPGDADVARAIRFIRESAKNGISVDDVLDAVPVSRRTLEIRFRHMLGRSPAEEIRRVRIERAKRMLIETDAGMDGVARGSGFSSANQLSETFRRETGVSPSQFRKQFRAV